MSFPVICQPLPCLHIICNRKVESAVHFPEENQLDATVQAFYRIPVGGMPGIIGAIDCTHVRIKRPTCNNPEIFRCRKGYFSLNVQVICGPDMRVTIVVALWQGSVHDSRILKNSLICQQLEDGQYPDHLLGDSGYPCRNYILTPLPNPQDQYEEAYNHSHIKTRNCIERACGMLKMRCSYVQQIMRTRLNTTKAIIVASMVLLTTRIMQPDYTTLCYTTL